MRTIVVVPTYNEANNIAPLTAALWELDLPDLAVLIVDDNSPDGTAAIAEDLARANPGRLYVLRRPGKQGLGTAYKAGFQRAIELGAEAVVQMDADFSHSPAYLPEMVSLLDEYDVVVGSRYVEGGRLDERWGFGRFLLSWWANAVYTRFILGTQQRDTTSGFRAWRTETLLGMGLHRIKSNGYDFQVELTYLTEKLGYRAREIPIYFEDRRIGQSKMSNAVKLESALRVWEIRWRYRGLSPADRMQVPAAHPSPSAS